MVIEKHGVNIVLMKTRRLLPLIVFDFAVILSSGSLLHAEINASAKDNQISLSTESISESWTVIDGHLKTSELVDKISGLTVSMKEEAFTLKFEGKKKIKASEMKIVKPAEVQSLDADAKASRLSDACRVNRLSLSLNQPMDRLMRLTK